MDPRIFMKVLISKAGEAESLVACAMAKRATAITNANSTSRFSDLSFGSILKKSLHMLPYYMLCNRVNCCLVDTLNNCHILWWWHSALPAVHQRLQGAM